MESESEREGRIYMNFTYIYMIYILIYLSIYLSSFRAGLPWAAAHFLGGSGHRLGFSEVSMLNS